MDISEALKTIFNGPFSSFLWFSQKLGDIQHEQANLIKTLFELESDIINIMEKYGKPIHLQEQKIVFEPILRQTEIIKEFTEEHSTEENLRLISDSIDIFTWMHSSDVKEFIQEWRSNLNFERKEMLNFYETKWLNLWINTICGFSNLIEENYVNGVVWQGTEKLPNQIFLGDVAVEFKRLEHIALLREINQGENILRILRARNNE